MVLANLLLLVSLVAGSPLEAGQAPAPRNAVSYDGYRIYSITPASPSEARDLTSRFSRYHTHPIRDALSVAIPPDEVATFESLGLNTRLVNADLGAHIRFIDNKPSLYNRALHKRGELPDLSWFDTYHPYADHLDYWDDLAHAFRKTPRSWNWARVMKIELSTHINCLETRRKAALDQRRKTCPKSPPSSGTQPYTLARYPLQPPPSLFTPSPLTQPSGSPPW